MSLTVKDALALEPLNRSKLLAGRSGLSREITWVSILEIYEEPTFFKPGYFLLFTAYNLAGDEALQEKFFAAAGEACLAGIVIKIGLALQRIPSRLLRLADHYGIPLIEISKDIPFAEISQAVLSELINRQFVLLKKSQAIEQKSQAIHKKLMQVELRGGGFQQIAKTLSKAIHASIIIVDSRSTILASAMVEARGLKEAATYFQDGLVLPVYYSTAVHGSISVQSHDADSTCFRISPLPQNSLPAITFAFIVFDNKTYGTIGIVEERPLEELDIMALEHGATIAALEFLKRKVERETERRLEGDLIDELLSGKAIPQESLERRLEFLGYDSSKPSRVMAIALAPLDGDSTESTPGEADLQRLYDLVRVCFEKIPSTVLIRSRTDSVVVVKEADPDGLAAEKRMAALLQSKVSQQMASFAPSIAIGRAYGDISDLHRSYLEAQKVLALMATTPVLGRVLSFEELGVDELLVEVSSSGAAAGYVAAVLGPVQEYDRKKRGSLLQTLQVYLANDANAQKAAEALFVHPHTVFYRLQQIEELTGRNLKSLADLLAFEVAIRLERLRGNSDN